MGAMLQFLRETGYRFEVIDENKEEYIMVCRL